MGNWRGLLSVGAPAQRLWLDMSLSRAGVDRACGRGSVGSGVSRRGCCCGFDAGARLLMAAVGCWTL